MRVQISDEIFESAATDDHLLIEIIGYALEGRYAIFFPTEEGTKSKQWRDSQSSNLQALWDLAIEGTKIEALSPSKITLAIEKRDQNSWDSTYPKLDLKTARDYLRKPFKVMVENATADRNFILAVTTEENRRTLNDFIDKGWLEFEHAGGINDIPNRLANWDKEEGRVLKGFVFFDSDGLLPNSRSNAADKAISACQARALDHCCLSRRMIENYLPREAIEMWIHANTFPGDRDTGERRRRYTGYLALNTDQRSHFNLKVGFLGDEGRITEENCKSQMDAFYQSLDPLSKERLKSGIHPKIAEIYSSGYMQQSWFYADGAFQEVNDIATRILKQI